MGKTYKYRAYPSDAVAREARRHRDVCRQVYNHALGGYHAAPDGEKPTYTRLQNLLPRWKRRWPEWTTVYSKCLQMAVRRIFTGLESLRELKSAGYSVGRLKWKSSREYRSITYNQSGFDVDRNTGRTGHASLVLSKIGSIDLKYHRQIPEEADIKQVVLKEEKSGKWFASVVVDQRLETSKIPVDEVDLEDTVGIDLGIQKFVHDSVGRAITPLDEASERRRIEKCHRELTRKEHGSNNWKEARRKLAEAYERLSNKRRDFREKLAHSYTRQYDAVFLEDLDVRGLLEQDWSGRNIAAMSWRRTIDTFERHGRKNGCHVETVPPAGTTKRCARCGETNEKEIWVREHACPECGFEADRDANAAVNVQKLGLDGLGIDYEIDELLGLGEAEDTPVETTLPGRTLEVPAKRVVETGSYVSPDTE